MSNPYSKLKDLHIWIIDDDPNLRQFIGLEIRNYGMTCDVASNAKEALVLFSNRPADFIVSDINMPGGSALEFLTEMKKTNLEKKPKIILISGYTGLNREEMNRLGVDEIMAKPFGPKDLLNVMINLLDK